MFVDDNDVRSWIDFVAFIVVFFFFISFFVVFYYFCRIKLFFYYRKP